MRLDKRLKLCADFVTDGSKVADIGTDHAYLPIYLVLSRKTENVIASDLNILPVKRAEENVKKYKLEKNIKILNSDGLSLIRSCDVDEIVIAGMGGDLIFRIISCAPWLKDKRFILQAMSSESDLRRNLLEIGFEIEEEKAVICKGKVYTVFSVIYKQKGKKVSIEYPYIGKLKENIDEAAIVYMRKQIKYLENQNKGNLKHGEILKYKENLHIIGVIQKIIDYRD